MEEDRSYGRDSSRPRSLVERPAGRDESRPYEELSPQKIQTRHCSCRLQFLDNLLCFAFRAPLPIYQKHPWCTWMYLNPFFVDCQVIYRTFCQLLQKGRWFALQFFVALCIIVRREYSLIINLQQLLMHILHSNVGYVFFNIAIHSLR